MILNMFSLVLFTYESIVLFNSLVRAHDFIAINLCNKSLIAFLKRFDFKANNCRFTDVTNLQKEIKQKLFFNGSE